MRFVDNEKQSSFLRRLKMLVEACLLKDREVAIRHMVESSGCSVKEASSFLKDMDDTTESISLTTNSFDSLSPEQRDAIKRSMEILLQQLGRTFLIAYDLSIGSRSVKPVQILEEAIDTATNRMFGGTTKGRIWRWLRNRKTNKS